MNTYTFRMTSEQGITYDVMVHAKNLAIASEAVSESYKSFWIESDPVSVEKDTQGKYCQGIFCDQVHKQREQCIITTSNQQDMGVELMNVIELMYYSEDAQSGALVFLKTAPAVIWC